MIKLHLTPDDSINESLKKYSIETEITIILSKGIYREKLNLYHHHLTLIGESMEHTIITYGDYSYKMHEDGLLYNTFRTSTVTVYGDDVRLENLTIRNDAGSGFTIGQAIALSLYGNESTVSSCILDGHQDTLFIGPLPDDLVERYEGFLHANQLHTKPLTHHFNHAIIKGDVDYIFGSGTAFFNTCHIIAKGKGYVCAPSTSSKTSYGFVFYKSLIENISKDAIYLARPWRDHGSTIFIDCIFKGLISDNRYDAWDKPHMRFFETPYIKSPLSKELSEEEKEQLIKQILSAATP
jgi:pectinesterase